MQHMQSETHARRMYKVLVQEGLRLASDLQMHTLGKVIDAGEQICHLGPCHSKAIKLQPADHGALELSQSAPVVEITLHLARWQRR